MNWSLFISTFSLIFFAELPDKTAFATLLMAARGRPLAIFIGVALAFLCQTLVAVTFGSLIGRLPESWVHLAAGIMFLGFAVHTWLQKEEEVEHEGEEAVTRAHFLPSVWKAFLVIFIAEWGDLTQIATAGIAAKYHEDLFTILCSATLALWAVTAVAVLLGQKLKHFIHFELLKKISVVVFVIVGGYFIWTWFRT